MSIWELATAPPPYTFLTWLQQWGSLLIALAALGLSAYSLWIRRTPKPHWGEAAWRLQMIAAVGTDRTALSFKIMQEGPGNAERVVAYYRRAGDPDWTTRGARPNGSLDHVTRGQTLEFQTITEDTSQAEFPPGTYEAKLMWRQLPDTTKVRSKIVRFTLAERG